MNPSKNDITGDSLISKPPSNLYRANFDKIFNKEKSNGKIEAGAQDGTTSPENAEIRDNAGQKNG